MFRMEAGSARHVAAEAMPPNARDRAEHPAVALTSEQVFPPDPLVAVLGGALAVGLPSYDAVLAEHVPLQPSGGSCRACGFVYTDRRVCPASILAAAGYPLLADRIRMAPAGNREYSALCELTVEVQRMGARLDVIGTQVNTATSMKRPRRTPWARTLGRRR